jgi:autotransporter translocation and assembly factor TamB
MQFAISDTLNGFLKFDFLQHKNPTLLLSDMGLTSNQFEWSGGSDSTMIVMGKDSVTVNHLDINSDGGQYINANGVFAFKGDENLNLSFKDINLGKFEPFVKLPFPLNGKANGNLLLTGTSSKPIIDANLRLDNYKVDTTVVDSLVVALNYLDELFVSKGHINIGKNQSVVADLKIPLRISFEDSIRFPKQGDKVAANMQITNLDLAIINSLMPTLPIKVDGILNSKFIVDGPFKYPDINGNLDIDKGKLDYNEYGVHYKNIDIKSVIANDSLYLRTFSADAGSGNFKANGSIKFKPDSLFVPESLDIHLKGKDFKALDSELIEATVNTQLDITGQYLKPQFKGSLEVLRSNVNADAFLARFDVVGDPQEKPYLVEALNTKGQTIEGKPFVPQKEKISILDQIDINGEFLVEIPGNCWIKGKDMNFEVKGELKAIVEKNLFSLVGKLDVKRGYYEIFGKRFDFESGSITLTGETDINPILDFNIYYSFRNIENVLQKLQLAISGRLKEPQIQFSLDNNQIEEKEAISYLLFGRSSEQLTEGQKSTTEMSAEGMAKNLAFGQLSTVLKNAMQQSLGLDVVEISGSDNLDQSSLKIGKYVTNNLFLSIQQTFSFNKQTTVNNPTQFGLEYQILRSLFLKATSQSTDAGFDLIYKKDFK